MQNLLVLYSALAVFGLGVTIVDLVGVFGHAAPSGGDSPGDDTDSDTDTADDSTEGSDQDHDGSADEAPAIHHGSYVASAASSTRAVAKAIGILRSGVYFSLGAGLTGLFSLITKGEPRSGMLWSAGAGVFIAVLASSLRAFLRKDLDSSIKPEEFIMDEAKVTVPIMSGAMGKVMVRHYGIETEVYARAKDPSISLPRGASVRIIDWDSDCYWVETLI